MSFIPARTGERRACSLSALVDRGDGRKALTAKIIEISLYGGLMIVEAGDELGTEPFRLEIQHDSGARERLSAFAVRRDGQLVAVKFPTASSRRGEPQAARSALDGREDGGALGAPRRRLDRGPREPL